MESITIDKIIRSKRRTVSIEVHPRGEVIVRAPKRASKQDINDFIEDKIQWIKKTLLRFKNHFPKIEEKKFITDEQFLYLGNSYPLQIVDDNHNPFVFDEHFKVTTTAQPQAKQLFTTWYQQKAHEILQERISHFAPLLAVNYQRMRLSNATKRWGSCSAKGSINFNWRLVMAPLPVIDYVVVHELAHLREMNHSSRFWQLVGSILPDYAEQRAWLQKFGEILVL